jgi:hypothetical protein
MTLPPGRRYGRQKSAQHEQAYFVPPVLRHGRGYNVSNDNQSMTFLSKFARVDARKRFVIADGPLIVYLVRVLICFIVDPTSVEALSTTLPRGGGVHLLHAHRGVPAEVHGAVHPAVALRRRIRARHLVLLRHHRAGRLLIPCTGPTLHLILLLLLLLLLLRVSVRALGGC